METIDRKKKQWESLWNLRKLINGYLQSTKKKNTNEENNPIKISCIFTKGCLHSKSNSNIL